MPPRDTKRSRQRESKNATEQESCRGTGARRGLRRADAGTRLPIFERRARAEARGGRATEGRAHLGARRARAVGRARVSAPRRVAPESTTVPQMRVRRELYSKIGYS